MSAIRASLRLPNIASRGLAAGLTNWRNLLWGAPALLACAYLIVLGADFQSVITSINMHGDVITAPVIAKLAGQAPPGSHVLIGHQPWYEEYLFLRATSGLPFYRQLWEVAPMLWTFLGFGILAWAAWRALGGFAALLTTSALVCLGSLGRFIFFAFEWHGITVLHTIVLAAALVWVAPRAATAGWVLLCSVAAGLGLLSAFPLASDSLFAVWALAPMGIVAVVMAVRNAGRARWTPLAFTGLILLVAAVGARVIEHFMRSHVTTIPFPYTLVGTVQDAVNYLELLVRSLMSLGGGDFFGSSLHLPGIARLISGVLILAALAFGLWEVRQLGAGRPSSPARRPIDDEPVASRNAASATPRLAYVTFWATSLALQAAAFAGTNVPKLKTGSVRYALASYVAVMALMPLVARRGVIWRIALTVGVSLFALSSIFQLAHRPYDPYGPYPGPPQAQRVLDFARAQHVNYGYAGYWDAGDITWLTRFNLQLYPVDSGCGPYGICPGHRRIDGWYRPRAGTRSLLVVDSHQQGVRQLPAVFGHPLATDRIGSITVAVYSYDIASKL